MKFNKDEMLAILEEDDNANAEIIANKIVNHSRWYIIYELIFKKDGKFYQTVYSIGATEQQDEGPFEYEMK